ncbi:cell division protein [Phaeovibrio sulfidiphilus]|uniref:Cell division protein n=1 Tax=Phaeovibrio sulfidiphilus TaxID=1220600 RepID=A0A8J7CWA4_9PROT|nr:FtsX-like permease family protein [Phaeovibrio sulfidiphilus]MBE1237246.1 cell division protein [Phaeovibrio sulfidiphilus]
MRWFRSTLPIPDGGATKSLMTIAGVMVFLAVLCLAGALVVQNMIGRWHTEVTGTLTIQVMPRFGDPAEADALTSADVDNVVREVTKIRGIQSVDVLGEADIRALLEPWLGSSKMVADLPLPRLVSVTLNEGVRLDVPTLQTSLEAIAPGVQVEDHRRFLSGLIVLARALSALAWLLVALVAAVTSITVVNATRSALTNHWPMIELLHAIGAHDHAIARRFEWLGARAALTGGGAGLVLASGAIFLIGGLARNVQSGIIPDLTLGAGDWVALASVPVCAALLAVAATRWTVLRALKRML